MAHLAPSQTGIDGRVVRRGEEGYEHLRRGAVWHEGVPDRYPEVIVMAANEADVVAAVRLAVALDLRVAVRSGGHSWSGSHVRDGSLLIDLSNLRHAEIDAASMTATVQPGIRGSEFMGMLREQDLFFPVGHNYAVGIGGYLLQGGFGWASREYGPACMSVIGIDAVTADGRLVHASETENAQLLWAARGAGPGFFAVVTRFHVRVYPRRPVTMSSTFAFPADRAAEVVRFFHERARSTPAEASVLIQRHAMTDWEPVVLMGAFAYTDTEEQARAQLAWLDECPAMPDALLAERYQPAEHGGTELDESTGVLNESRRWIADNIVTDADADPLLPNLERLIEKLPAAPSYLLLFNWDGSPDAVDRPSMAFSLRGDFCYSLYTAWDSREDDRRYTDWTTETMRAWEPYASFTMLSDENLLNRPAPFMAPKHLARLDELRTAWDPAERFVSWLGRPTA